MKNRRSAEELIQSIKNSMSAKEWKKFCIRYKNADIESILWYIKTLNNGKLPENTFSTVKKAIAEGASDK